MKFSTARNGALAFFALMLLSASPMPAQAFPPGTFHIDGIPVSCGPVTTVLVPTLRDVGSNDLRGHIYINPNVPSSQPTVLKLFWFAHECGHSNVGPSETAADCWAIKTGKAQGWFPPDAFEALEAVFADNPGDWTHLPGPQRVAEIEKCYGYKNKTNSNNEESSASRSLLQNEDESSDDICGAIKNILKDAPSLFRHFRARRRDEDTWIASVTLPGAVSCVVESDSTYPHLQCSFRAASESDISKRVARCLDRSKWDLHASEGYFDTKDENSHDRTEIRVHRSSRNSWGGGWARD